MQLRLTNFIQSILDLMNISVVTVFAVIHRSHDGFTYGPSFWFTVCSTIVSTATSVTLIVDCVCTKDFTHSGKVLTTLFLYLFICLSGSGLTNKHRSVVIVVIVLLSYISIGSVVEAKLMDIPYIDALYFSVVSIETIGNSAFIIFKNDIRLRTFA